MTALIILGIVPAHHDVSACPGVDAGDQRGGERPVGFEQWLIDGRAARLASPAVEVFSAIYRETTTYLPCILTETLSMRGIKHSHPLPMKFRARLDEGTRRTFRPRGICSVECRRYHRTRYTEYGSPTARWKRRAGSVSLTGTLEEWDARAQARDYELVVSAERSSASYGLGCDSSPQNTNPSWCRTKIR